MRSFPPPRVFAAAEAEPGTAGRGEVHAPLQPTAGTAGTPPRVLPLSHGGGRCFPLAGCIPKLNQINKTTLPKLVVFALLHQSRDGTPRVPLKMRDHIKMRLPQHRNQCW